MPQPSARPPSGPYEGSVGVDVVVLAHGLGVPASAMAGDAGLDLSSTVDLDLGAGQRALVGTGIAIALPAGYVGLVHPRSGLALHAGVTVLNAPGTVDAGFRGEITVCLINHDRECPAAIRRGDRIAQLLVQRVERVEWSRVDELDPAERGLRGHGSSGGYQRPLGAPIGGPGAVAPGSSGPGGPEGG